MPGHLAELAAIATGTVLTIVAQLAAVFSMTILSAWGSAGQRWHWLACMRCRRRWPAWRHHVRLASCSGFIIVGRSATPTVKLLINYTLCLA